MNQAYQACIVQTASKYFIWTETVKNLTSNYLCRGEWGNPKHLLIEAYKVMVKQSLVERTIPIKRVGKTLTTPPGLHSWCTRTGFFNGDPFGD